MKLAANNKKKEAKAKAKEATGVKAAKPKIAAADDEELNPSQYLEIRQAMIRQLENEGGNAYPHKFQCTCSIPQFVKTYTGLKDGVHTCKLYSPFENI